MNLLQRLEANSTWEPNGGCRLWLGALNKEHGVIKVAGKQEQVHRVAWELERGPIPRGLWVLHNCGVGPCFNINHLRLGTRDDNAVDRVRHGGYLGRLGGGLDSQIRMASKVAAARVKVVDLPLSHDELRRIMSYDPASGELRWRTRADRDQTWNTRFAGEVAGAVLKVGYRYINFNKKLHLAHRIAWFWMTGAWPDSHIDHINGKRDDNRWDNLRGATAAENGANVGLRSTNKSGVKGVCWVVGKGRWRALITLNGKDKFLGYYRTLAEAAEARRIAEASYHGEFTHKAGTA